MEFSFELKDDREFRQKQIGYMRKFRAYSERLSSANQKYAWIVFLVYFLYFGIVALFVSDLITWGLEAEPFALEKGLASLISLIVEIILIVIGMLVTLRLFRKLCAKSLADGQAFTMKFDSEGLKTSSSTGTTLTYWSAVEFAHLSNDGIYIQIPLSGLWINQNYFANSAEKQKLAQYILDHLREDVRQKIEKAQPKFAKG